MIIHRDIEQGSIDWLFLRAGKATASRFGSILTPKQMRLSEGSDDYALKLALERIYDAPLSMDVQGTMWTERGVSLEEEARDWYAMNRGVDVVEVGFVERSDMPAGCSPDGLVFDGERIEGGCEIKCREAKNHSRCVLGWDDIAKTTQVQGSLWVTGADWWDVVAYCPKLPGRIQRVLPDPAWQEAFDAHIPVFLDGVERVKAQLLAFGKVRWDDELDGQLKASVAAIWDGVA